MEDGTSRVTRVPQRNRKMPHVPFEPWTMHWDGYVAVTSKMDVSRVALVLLPTWRPLSI